MTNRMKRLGVGEPGIDAMQLVDDARPEPLPGEVLVKVLAVALNYRDMAILQGTRGAWSSHCPGSDMAGKVIAVGADVTQISSGDRAVSLDISNSIDGPAPQEGTNNALFFGRLAD